METTVSGTVGGEQKVRSGPGEEPTGQAAGGGGVRLCLSGCLGKKECGTASTQCLARDRNLSTSCHSNKSLACNSPRCGRRRSLGCGRLRAARVGLRHRGKGQRAGGREDGRRVKPGSLRRRPAPSRGCSCAGRPARRSCPLILRPWPNGVCRNHAASSRPGPGRSAICEGGASATAGLGEGGESLSALPTLGSPMFGWQRSSPCRIPPGPCRSLRAGQSRDDPHNCVGRGGGA